MKQAELNIAQKIGLETLWAMARIFAVLPYWFKYYVVENLIFVVLYYCLRYRMQVVRTNLRNSFPEKSDAERAAICRSFYRTLAEIFVDTVNMAHKNEKKALEVISISGCEQHRAAVHGRDWIAMTAHFGCWEYFSYWSLFDRSQMLVGVYHPLRSKVVDQFYCRLRNSDSTMTVTMKDSLRFYMRHREHGIDGRRIGLGLIADQNPPRRPDSHWFRFLNQDTIFFDGGEKLALRFNLPVYFVSMKRLRRGCYEASFELIYDGQEQVAEYEITERYVRRLETMIREHPELWVWSHRRWKHKRNPNADC